MALDEVLLDAVADGRSSPVLRLYRWQPATVTLGYGQSLGRDVDIKACHEAGLDIVRRVTGGRAVLHQDEVTYAVIAPVHEGRFQGTVLDCYRVIAEVLRETVSAFGVDAELVPGSRTVSSAEGGGRAVCFTAPSQYELVVDGRKIAGSAQRRVGRTFLQHGSLPLTMDLELLSRVLKGADRLPLEQRFAKIGWLNLWAPTPLGIDGVEDQLVDSFKRVMNVEWQVLPPTEEEILSAETLCRAKYANPDWTGRVDSH